MTRDTKMLQLILDGQSKLMKEIKENTKAIKKVDERVSNLALHLADVDDDAPAGEDFIALERRVFKIEKKLALI